jgi:hypothetical protein
LGVAQTQGSKALDEPNSDSDHYISDEDIRFVAENARRLGFLASASKEDVKMCKPFPLGPVGEHTFAWDAAIYMFH